MLKTLLTPLNPKSTILFLCFFLQQSPEKDVSVLLTFFNTPPCHSLICSNLVFSNHYHSFETTDSSWPMQSTLLNLMSVLNFSVIWQIDCIWYSWLCSQYSLEPQGNSWFSSYFIALSSGSFVASLLLLNS